MEHENVLELYNNSLSESRQILAAIVALLAQQETTIQNIINARVAAPRVEPIQPVWQSRRTRARQEPTPIVLPTIPSPAAVDISLNAVEDLLFSQVPENDRYESCPITYEEFGSESEITRIRHCGHYFSRQAITRWLTTNSCCPICRHNTRPEIATAHATAHATASNRETLIDNMIGILTSDLSSENNMSAFNSLVFHFDIAENID